jgi:hypothetical protein
MLELYNFINKKERVPLTNESVYIKNFAFRQTLSEVEANDIIEMRLCHDDESQAINNKNSYSTHFKVKGLEFSNVILLLTTSGTMFFGPKGMTINPVDLIESEFYTMLTRARDNIMVIMLDSTVSMDEREKLKNSSFFNIKTWCEKNLTNLNA